MAEPKKEEYDPSEHREVERPTKAEPKEEEYNPFEHREVERPTNDWETLVHLLKGALGTGVLAIPLATSYAGLWFGLFSTAIIGFILTYCVYLVVKNSQRLCVRLKVPLLAYDEVGQMALLYGPPKFRKFSLWVKYTINICLIINLFGCCTVYSVFSAQNLKQVIDAYGGMSFTEREYILMLLPFLMLYIMIRTLKFLAPLSFAADVMVITGLLITLYYMFTDLPSISPRPAFGSLIHFPLYFGVAIFALEGIAPIRSLSQWVRSDVFLYICSFFSLVVAFITGVVMPLENNMKTPQHFIQGPCVCFIGFGIVVGLYSVIGFVGYWRYGEDIQGSITLNVPQDQVLGQSVKVLFAIAMFQTFGIQFYVPFQIIWRSYKHRFGKWNLLYEYCARWSITIICIMVAYAIPSISCIMSLCGSGCLSFVGIIFPAFIDYAVCYKDPGLGKYKWRLIVDILLLIFGCLGFFFGTYVAVLEIFETFIKDRK